MMTVGPDGGTQVVTVRIGHAYRLNPTASPGNNGTTTATRGGNGFNYDTNFDTNMVIILAALLCALILALGLNSIIRCALRCSRRIAFESPDSPVGRLATTGLRKSKLKELPVSVYGSPGADVATTDCAICLGEFVDGEKVRVLPKCRHSFHVRCVDIWLSSHSSCPTCRRSLSEQVGAAAPPRAASAATAARDVEVGATSSS